MTFIDKRWYKHPEKTDAVKYLCEKIDLLGSNIADDEKKKSFHRSVFSCIKDIMINSKRNTNINIYIQGHIKMDTFRTLAKGDDEIKTSFVSITGTFLKSLINEDDQKKLIEDCGGISTFLELGKEAKSYGVEALYIIHYCANLDIPNYGSIYQDVLNIMREHNQETDVVIPCLYILKKYRTEIQDKDYFTVTIPKDDSILEGICDNLGVGKVYEEPNAKFEEYDFGSDRFKSSFKVFLRPNPSFSEKRLDELLGEIEKIVKSDEILKNTFLNKEEIKIIYAYMSSTGIYHFINGYLRERKEFATESEFIVYLFRAIRRLPLKYYRSLYRGLTGRYKCEGMTSTSKDFGVAHNFPKGPKNKSKRVLCINNAYGYDLCFIADNEGEVITDPDSLSDSFSKSIHLDESTRINEITMKENISDTRKFPPGPYDNFAYSVVRLLNYCINTANFVELLKKNVKAILSGAVLKEEGDKFRHFGGFNMVFELLSKKLMRKEPEKRLKENLLIILEFFIRDNCNL